MKTLKILVSFCIIFLLFVIGSCKGPINQIDEQSFGDLDLKKGTPKKLVELTQGEIDGILFMREEEKLARDVYVEFYKLYDNSIFLNISESEDSHMAAMLRLINFYKLDDSASPDPGVFNNPDLQEVYNEMISEGSADLIAALNVGLKIELNDIEDLNEYLDTDVKNLLQVYDHLLKGSENHLKSFEKVLDKLEKKVDK